MLCLLPLAASMVNELAFLMRNLDSGECGYPGFFIYSMSRTNCPALNPFPAFIFPRAAFPWPPTFTSVISISPIFLSSLPSEIPESGSINSSPFSYTAKISPTLRPWLDPALITTALSRKTMTLACQGILGRHTFVDHSYNFFYGLSGSFSYQRFVKIFLIPEAYLWSLHAQPFG